MAQHKPKDYTNLSGWLTKYFPDILVRHCNRTPQTKALFGSGRPMITLERWLVDYQDIAFKKALCEDFTKGNTAPLLGVA